MANANISQIQLPSGDAFDLVDKKSGYITGMTILSYGSSNWSDFETAYNANKTVYCRASSNTNPATGSQTRLAFMAYVNNATTPTNVEFQYYRSVSTHSASQQGDQVYVYKLDKTNGWSVTTREASVKISINNNNEGIKTTYSSGTVAIGHANSVTAQSTSAVYPITYDAQGHITSGGTAVTIPTQASDIGAQPTLVSGTNIKTINSNSLLGIGNLVVDDVIEGYYNEIDHKFYDSLGGVTIDDQPAYLNNRQYADTLLTEDMLEDPSILEDLIDSGLINLTGALSRGQVKSISTLTQTCDSLTVITSSVVDTYDTTYTYDYSDYPTIVRVPALPEPTEIVGETGKIYIDLSTNKLYRWSGTAFVEIASGSASGGVSDVEVNGASVVSSGVAQVTVPTTTSGLVNDSNYIQEDASGDASITRNITAGGDIVSGGDISIPSGATYNINGSALSAGDVGAAPATWTLKGSATGGTDTVTIPETANEAYIYMKVGNGEYTAYVYVKGVTISRLEMGGYYISTSDNGLCNLNVSNNNRTYQIRNARYASIDYKSSAKITVYYR